ncbi:type IX secretion system membrane protein PorP/SprF [Pontibacter diazotrophicus]|uniref:Type IX secretion system membrane protein PorP/SprF n=1 Tax=Pontibacter diazotrophicus TaxID=1400979 RepID=A0A3D8L6W5_9BACT|nr:type IX secretion system membrane protein PorP/SprF [Pontibacter diazotrophicus]RDV13117.1 type IX secretion system membrane protein PorP/SprF [Pontibacter diazotrophicus]
MKNYILIFCFLLVGSAAVAQQKALYSQYMTNYYLLNPAVAGIEKDWNLKAGYRNQWVGFEGAPKTFYLSGEAALFKKDIQEGQAYHGVGGYVYTDQTGPTTRTGMLLSYAYHVPLNEKVYLSSGVFAGFQQYRFDADKIYLAEGSNERDPVTRNGNLNSFMPDLSVGTFIHSDKFFAGVSLFQVLGNRIFEMDDVEDPSRLARHLMVSGGYNLDVHRNIVVTPSVLLKYVNAAPLQADLNIKGAYHFTDGEKSKHDNMVWAGVSYRTNDAVVGLMGLQFKQQYELSYSYDITTSPMSNYSAGSHEIMLGFRLN